jgi:hypothetical protein
MSCCCGTQEESALRHASAAVTARDRLGHVLARWGVRRSAWRVAPGLYALGEPGPASPVLVTANYKLSFDALRSSMAGHDAWILVLDTRGINVWCAAGKGTFGTDELVRRIETAGLADVVEHRNLVLPQLGAPGVAAHEVTAKTGFVVEYGPVRAPDLPEYLRAGEATPEMRRVRFGLWDRLAVTPVDLVRATPYGLGAALLLWLLVGPLAAIAALGAVVAGVVLFPALLPWIPSPNFSTKGWLLGLLVALPFAAGPLLREPGTAAWLRWGIALACLLALPSVTAFLALNFTGSTTFTSRSGVKREILAYFPAMAWTFGAGVLLVVGLGVARLLGAA